MPGNATAEYALYLRKSKGRAGIARQRTITTAHIERLGGVIAAEFPDTDRTAFRKIGADRPERERFDEMLGWLSAHPGAGIAAWHADRLLRDPDDTEHLIRACLDGGHLIETPSGGTYDVTTATGRKRLRQDALDATYEVDHMTERITAAKAEAAANGDWRGGRRPFGYAPDGVTVVPDEAALVASGSEAILAGTSLAAISRAWNASGLPTTTGKAWRPREVSRVLLRPRNAALMEHQGKILEGVSAAWPPIVEERIWRGVAAALADPGRRTTTGPGRVWLLSGIAECGVCGRGLIVSKAAGKGRPMRPVYRCRPERASGAQGHLARDAAALEEYITRLVLARLGRPDAAQLLRPAPAADGAAQLHAHVAAARERLDQAAGMFADGQIDARQLATITGRLNAELEDATGRLADLGRRDALAAFRGRTPADVWAGLDLDQRRAVISVMMRIVVEPAGRGRPPGWQPGQSYFNPDTIGIEWRREVPEE